jgi:hypothetical protein
VRLYPDRYLFDNHSMMLTISHAKRRTFGRIIVAEAGERTNNNHKIMENNSSTNEPHNVSRPTLVAPRLRLENRQRSRNDAAARAELQKQMTRILDNWANRTRAILASLDISIDGFHAEWGPCGDVATIAEKLSHIEIIPEVKANVLPNGN